MSEHVGGRDISIRVPILARVEGEGALDIDITKGQITNLQFRIYEPARLFEKFLEGRAYHEVIDIVPRICGICPVAYQMSAVHAIEKIFDVTIDPWARAMRRVMYCGEWIESHSLHIHLLALPDFLGYRSVVEMAKDYPTEVKRGLALQGLGNELMRLMGGRSVNPIGTRVGGFHRAPPREQVQAICRRLREALPLAEETLAWVASLPMPDDPQSFPSVALRHSQEYGMNEGRIISDQGLNIAMEEYEQHFVEHQVPHSTALHSLLHGKPYLVGPLARVNLNQDLLPPQVQQAMASAGLRFPSNNMFHSMAARAVEIYFALTEALRYLESEATPASPYVSYTTKAGTGMHGTEAPRGLLWHRYATDDQGIVQSAKIVAPTSQNQARIEQDLRFSLERLGLDRSEEELQQHAETVTRNYDPCISCSTHFVKLAVHQT